MERKHFKYIVVGSGAGGAVAAWRLAEHLGDQVALVEAGKYWTRESFNQIEEELLPALYAQGGAQGTEDGTLSVLQGVAVGGSTLVNDGLCFRPPEEIVERWKAYGVDVDYPRLSAAADIVENAMGVVPIPETQINRGNYLLGLGAAKLGYAGERLRHNSPGCVQCGFRSLGCAYDAKQSTNLSFVPRFIDYGGTLLDETQVISLQSTVGDGWRLTTNRGELTAERVILAAGIVQTPMLLLRSGMSDIGAGLNLQFHLQTAVWGDFVDPVDHHNGIPMAYGVMEFADVYDRQGLGYLIEGVGYLPVAIAAQTKMMGERHEEFLRRYRHLSGAVMLLRSSSRGQVSMHPTGRPSIKYDIDQNDWRRTERFFHDAFDIYAAAGAKTVWTSHKTASQLLSRPQGIPVGPGQQVLYTAHPFGGATLGTTLNPDHSVRGQRNLWVTDASAIPEALGVNPQITIMAMAVNAIDNILSE